MQRQAELMAEAIAAAKQAAILPADDILVRGSDAPAATPEELLRAAQDRLDPEDMLRASTGVK